MKTYTSFRLNSLINSFTIIFFGFTLLWAVGNYIVIQDVLISWPVFIVNFSLSVGLGLWLYRQRYHLQFSYNDDHFDLWVGKFQIERRWKEFSSVSLYHRGNEEFIVRLYEKEDEFVEIPVSALKIQPNEFRHEVMGLVK